MAVGSQAGPFDAPQPSEEGSPGAAEAVVVGDDAGGEVVIDADTEVVVGRLVLAAEGPAAEHAATRVRTARGTTRRILSHPTFSLY
jgi:hypothetical protein